MKQNQIPAVWKIILELISDDQSEFDSLSKILVKQFKKLKEYDKTVYYKYIDTHAKVIIRELKNKDIGLSSIKPNPKEILSHHAPDKDTKEDKSKANKDQEAPFLEIKFPNYVKEDGHFYKNERINHSKTFFDDLNYGDLSLKLPNIKITVNSKLKPKYVEAVSSLQKFVSKVGVISDQKEITGLVN